jgi:D-specific alpha-keto acid dehydrogenase
VAYREPAGTAAAVSTLGLTVYGCGRDEAVLFRHLASRFGVVPTITEAPLSEANVELALGNRCISVSHRTHISAATLRALSRRGVTYLSTRSIGYDHIDVTYAESLGISVENVSYSPAGVADFTLMLILMAIRQAKSLVRRADARDYRLNDVPGKELRDLTIGVVGTGRIGAAVIQRLAGFGCRILAHDARPKTGADYVPLHDLLQLSDVVTLHTPLTPATHHLLNHARVELMKQGAVVVNTGRGSLVETEALIRALEHGKLGGAALDVLEGEEGVFYFDRRAVPVERDPFVRLHRLPNVVLTPHTAYYTDRALNDIVENTLGNCVEFQEAA